MRNFYFFIISIFFLISCKSLTKDDLKYVGDWQFIYTDDSLLWDNIPRTFWDLKTINSLKLEKNRNWSLGYNSGTWGCAKKIDGYSSSDYNLDLQFKDNKFIAYNASNINNIEAFVIKIENIDVIKITIKYSYRDIGLIDDPIKGAVQVPNMEYHSDVNYYFIRDINEKNKIINHFLTKINNENQNSNSSSYNEQVNQFQDEQSDLESNVKSFIVKIDKAYFYKESNNKFKRKAYLIKGQSGDFSIRENDYVFAKYTNEDGVVTEGWISINDIEISE